MKQFSFARFAHRYVWVSLFCSMAFVAGCAKTGTDKVTSAKNNSSTESPSTANLTWTESWDEAVALSKMSRKPILADFTGSDW